MNPAGLADKLFSVLLVCYGNHPQYSCRAINSLTQTPKLADRCDVLVGGNDCCQETRDTVRRGLDAGLITGWIQSTRNLHKQPMHKSNTMAKCNPTPTCRICQLSSTVFP